MKVIPAVDIKEGRCVQLVEGDPSNERFSGDPVEAAESWISQGADLLHVVNLDGAFSEESDLSVIEEVLSLADKSQVGGGVRSVEYAEELLDLGADRVIVGTKALDQGFMEELSAEVGPERLIAALDCRGDEVLVKGWTERSGRSFDQVVDRLDPLVWGFLYTDVDREGRMEGVSRENVEKFVGETGKPVIASGGVSTLEDVEALDEAGAWGAVIGSALYENAFTLKEAMEVTT